MRRLVIADAHLGQRPGDAAVMLRLLAGASRAGVDELVYLGDVCQYLIGMSTFWTATVRSLLGAWKAFREGGGRVVLIEGNRDFFLDEPELAEQVDAVLSCYEFAAGARRFHLVHGDKVNRRDLQYRFWAAVSKSGPARLWARLLPRGTAVSIVQGMERRLAASNRRFRYQLPEQDLRRYAAAVWAAGSDVVMWGHFHQEWRWRCGDAVALVVADWLATRRAVLVDREGGMSVVDHELRICETGLMPAQRRGVGDAADTGMCR